MACEEIPIKIDLDGTLGDDVYWIFDDFTIDGAAYPVGTTAKLYMELVETPATNYELDGTFDPESTGNLSKLSFKFLKADNTDIGKYNYDIKVTYPNADVFTHVIGDIDITADVKNAAP
jgi:hypothetical protein